MCSEPGKGNNTTTRFDMLRNAKGRIANQCATSHSAPCSKPKDAEPVLHIVTEHDANWGSIL